MIRAPMNIARMVATGLALLLCVVALIWAIAYAAASALTVLLGTVLDVLEAML